MNGDYQILKQDLRMLGLKKGDSVLLPCSVPHAVVCHEAGIVVDIFTPMREDFV